MAVGSASGEGRARTAAEQAITSNLLDVTIDGARGILFNITGGPDMSLFEVHEAATLIKTAAHPDCNVIFGAVIDESMKEQIRITVVATGFDQTAAAPRRPVRSQQTTTTTTTTSAATPRPIGRTSPKVERDVTEPVPIQTPARQQPVDPDNLELPSFLRRPRQ